MIAQNAEELEIPLEIGSGEALSVFPYLEAETLPQGSVTAILKVAEVSPELPPLLLVRLSEEGVEPEPYVLMGYQAMQVAIEAASAQAADTTTALQTSTFKTILGAVRFDENSDNSVPQYRPYRWINKAFKSLQDREASQ
jgi:ABC-type branched-subunit amino acid transport system substrate-binding protein